MIDMIESIDSYLNSINPGYIFLVLFPALIAFLLFATSYKSKKLRDALAELEEDKLQTN